MTSEQAFVVLQDKILEQNLIPDLTTEDGIPTVAISAYQVRREQQVKRRLGAIPLTSRLLSLPDQQALHALDGLWLETLQAISKESFFAPRL